MKNALIDNRFQVQYIASWSNKEPIYAFYPNSCRVCEVTAQPFEVALPLFWVDCNDDVVADLYWYDLVNKIINPIENAPIPENQVGIGVTIV